MKKLGLFFLTVLVALFVVACGSAPPPPAPIGEQTVIAIRRASSAIDPYKNMEVYIDGLKRDIVKDGEQKTFAVPTGNHNIYVKINKRQSQMLLINPKAKTVAFLSTIEGRGSRAMLVLTEIATGASDNDKNDSSADSGTSSQVINIQVQNSSSSDNANTNNITDTDE
ncbi:hypothetical protein [Treponema primitia]|uniref:hypothetical protein n=1 Tax=Treponema primitia TaxID=88058 RepID=UPI000255534E|nr:hypothetical protein [Treponema primitia]